MESSARRTTTAGVLIILFLTSKFVATSASVLITANLTGSQTPLVFSLLDCVGSGHGALTLREDYRNHLRKVQADIGFSSIRGHAWLTDDMSTYLPMGGENANMYNIFSTIDFYLSVGIKPIMELSFMPDALTSGSHTIMHYKGNTDPPKSYQAWADFISEVYTLLVARYGIVEVRSWRNEVWNEPGLKRRKGKIGAGVESACIRGITRRHLAVNSWYRAQAPCQSNVLVSNVIVIC